MAARAGAGDKEDPDVREGLAKYRPLREASFRANEMDLMKETPGNTGHGGYRDGSGHPHHTLGRSRPT